jgi:hypothetical protein
LAGGRLPRDLAGDNPFRPLAGKEMKVIKVYTDERAFPGAPVWRTPVTMRALNLTIGNFDLPYVEYPSLWCCRLWFCPRAIRRTGVLGRECACLPPQLGHGLTNWRVWEVGLAVNVLAPSSHQKSALAASANET